jgi:hypothetical protein
MVDKEKEQAPAMIAETVEEEKDKEHKDESVSHIDFCETELSTRMDESPEGFLIGRAVVTNIGVFTYLNKDGTTRKELRLPDEVFHQDSLASYVGKPITNSHPTKKGGIVDVTNCDELAVGTMMGPIQHDEFHVSAGLSIMKPEGKQAVKNGRRSLSVGYRCDLDWTPGTWMGMNYDCIQRNIRVNHVALVDRGRAGDAAKLRLDDADSAIMMVGTDILKEDGMADKSFHTINLDNVDYQAEDAVIEAFQKAKERADGTQVKLDALTADKSKVEAERDAQKERADALEKEVADLKATNLDEAKVNEKVQARLNLLAIAQKAEIKTDGLDDKAIKLAVIKSVSPSVNLDGKDDSYVTARFDIAVEMLNEKKETKAASAVRSLNADSEAKPSEIVEAKKRSDAQYGKRSEGGK